ncbi:hypothetical protein C8Q76DRAFT_790209 [Earliella scabrosa]|nr:hypothetical protein C8Q76DRAFT_790209 [Earliella scabrosa]
MSSFDDHVILSPEFNSISSTNPPQDRSGLPRPVPVQLQGLTGPIIVHEDIHVLIMQRSSVSALCSWRRTCRAYYTVVATVLRDRYAMCVSPFVSNLESFNHVLRACGGVISGSVALRFFLPDESWVPGDLDIYLSDRMFETFVAVVCKDPKIAFEFLPNEDQPVRRSGPVGIAGIREVHRFRTPTGRYVDVIRSSMSSPVTPIRAFWSTLVMNFITPDGCACGFPRGTLDRRGAVRGELNVEKDRVAADKYAERGFHFTGGPWSRSLSDPSTWDVDYFGDIDAIVLPYRLRLRDELHSMPIVRTKRGWRIKLPFPRISSIWRQLRLVVNRMIPLVS